MIKGVILPFYVTCFIFLLLNYTYACEYAYVVVILIRLNLYFLNRYSERHFHHNRIYLLSRKGADPGSQKRSVGLKLIKLEVISMEERNNG